MLDIQTFAQRTFQLDSFDIRTNAFHFCDTIALALDLEIQKLYLAALIARTKQSIYRTVFAYIPFSLQ